MYFVLEIFIFRLIFRHSLFSAFPISFRSSLLVLNEAMSSVNLRWLMCLPSTLTPFTVQFIFRKTSSNATYNRLGIEGLSVSFLYLFRICPSPCLLSYKHVCFHRSRTIASQLLHFTLIASHVFCSCTLIASHVFCPCTLIASRVFLSPTLIASHVFRSPTLIASRVIVLSFPLDQT